MTLLQLLAHGPLCECYIVGNKDSAITIKNDEYIKFTKEVNDIINKCINDFIIKNKYDFLFDTSNNRYFKNKQIKKKYNKYIKTNNINLDLILDDNKKQFIEKYFYDNVSNDTDNLLYINEIYEKYKNRF